MNRADPRFLAAYAKATCASRARPHRDRLLERSFQQTNHDLQIILRDGGDLPDNSCRGATTILLSPEARQAGAWTCGGHTVFLVIGTDVKPDHVPTAVYHGEALLRLAQEGLGITGSDSTDGGKFLASVRYCWYKSPD